MMEENKISVVINTYNAEQFLEEVLEAVSGFDEVVICDMESQDSTVAIAEKHGCRVVTFPKGNITYVEPARNFAIQSARYRWVLVVDADELVTPKLRDYLYCRIHTDGCPAGIFIPRRNRFMNHLKVDRVRDYQLRFFLRNATDWPAKIHVQPTVQGRVEKVDTSEKEVCFIHLAENYLHEVIQKTNVYTDGEVDKRADKNYGVGALLWRPVWRFFKSYIMDGNIRNGITGFVESNVAAMYQFLMVAKIIEKRMKDNDKKHVS